MKTADFRAKIEARLTAMGFNRATWMWQAQPSRLVIIINGQFREVPIRPGMSASQLEYEIGRVRGWADHVNGPPAELPMNVRQIDFSALRGAKVA